MSIKKIDAYILVCDKCKEDYEGFDFTIWVSGEDARENAQEDGWVYDSANDKDYCSGCFAELPEQEKDRILED